MKRLLIDDGLRDLAKEYKKALAKKFTAKPTKKLEDLKSQLPVDYEEERTYIQNIIDNYESIILLEPEKFDKFQEDFFNIGDVSKPVIKKVKDRKTKKTKTEEKKLHERIVECMRYEDIRTDIYPLLFPKLNLHTCPYCNAQYLDVVERKAGERGNFQLDHAYPKSKYPWLCTTFFNMVPSCGSCNLAKHADAPVYNFYTNDYAKLYPFHFRLEAKSLLRYLLTQDEKKLEIKLDTTEDGLDNYEQAFSIESLYSSYNDIVEEIIWKAKIYNESFKANLEESLGRLFPYCGDQLHRTKRYFETSFGSTHGRHSSTAEIDIKMICCFSYAKTITNAIPDTNTKVYGLVDCDFRTQQEIVDLKVHNIFNHVTDDEAVPLCGLKGCYDIMGNGKREPCRERQGNEQENSSE